MKEKGIISFLLGLGKKAKIALLVGFVFIILFIGIRFTEKIGPGNIVTSSQLIDAMEISDLSTAEFMYNGIAVKYKEKNPEEVEYYIAYDSVVKVGVDMSKINFEIDNQNKTVKPVLPEVKINEIFIDENSFSYIPKNPDLSMQEIITICKDDVQKEAGEASELFEIAQENLRDVVEALIMPILEYNEYEIIW